MQHLPGGYGHQSCSLAHYSPAEDTFDFLDRAATLLAVAGWTPIFKHCALSVRRSK
jgi:hypothetical protein